MQVDLSNSSMIACLCEGGAETAIMDILLDKGLLLFDRDRLIEHRVLPRVPARTFEQRYLRAEYEGKIVILRIIDSRNEGFSLKKIYQDKVEVVTVITAPEIEMLIIVKEGKYKDYSSSGIKKPSEYCKSVLGYKEVKTVDFIKRYFSDPKDLVTAINKYHGIHKQKPGEASLYDLLKNKT